MIGIHRPRSKAGMIVHPRPLVGFTGVGNSISVQYKPDGIKCRVSTGSYLFVLAGTATFGPALEFLLYFRPEKLQPNTPGVILGAIWFLTILSSAAFVRYALGCPRFRAYYGRGDLEYFAWSWSRPSLVLRRGEVRKMEVEERSFLSEGIRVPNFCITVTTHKDRQYTLCISTDERLIRSLHSELEKLLVGRI